MKKLILILFCLLVQKTACFADHFPLQIDDFEILEIRISGNIEWTSSQPGGSVICSSAQFQEIEIEQNGKKLTLNWKNNGKSNWQSGTDKIAFQLSSELLRRVEITGSAGFNIKGINKTPEFSLAISGSGDFRGKLDCSGKSNFSLSGSGNISAEGSCREMNLRIAGSGDFRGKTFESMIAKVSISGSGDAEVFASKELDAAVSGSGDIRYWGNPEKATKAVAGSGEVQKGG
jgi:hypothetical protein